MRIPSTDPPGFIHLDRSTCANLSESECREWLVTNGLGGFASGTVAGLLTRRYHGLLIAALVPPRRRTLLVAKFDEIATIGDQSFSLGANRWADGTISPQGYQFLESFRLEGSIPVWSYSFGGALLEKRVWMRHGSNTTCVEYSLLRATAPVDLSIKALVNSRDFHGTTRAGDLRMSVEPLVPHASGAQGVRIAASAGGVPFYIRSAEAAVEPAFEWYYNYDLAAERERGFEGREDHLHAATLRVTLRAGQSMSVILSTDAEASLDSASARSAEESRARGLLSRWSAFHPPEVVNGAPGWIRQLVLAGDQFLIECPGNSAADAASQAIIAGFPWFGVWSRDAMISLPGLALATGRADFARRLLLRFAGLVNAGMLPNFLPESGGAPSAPLEYNSVDAPLWFIEAAHQYAGATGDAAFAREVLPAIREILSAYACGTRFGIHADLADGLLCAGLPATDSHSATNLTWMDARVDGQPVTPRIGKPIEVNALWINALDALAALESLSYPSRASANVPSARSAGPASDFSTLARSSFSRFWNPARNCCFDVLDGPAGNDASLRPNQIFAVSLAIRALTPAQERAVVDACARHLLTPLGLRSLAPGAPEFRAQYAGSPAERDAAYHQGTVWAWLLGPFALAHFRVYNDRAAALAFLDPIADHISAAGLGGVSEIFDAERPFTPRGCPWQAWSVAEILRAWNVLQSASVPFSGTTPVRSQRET